MDYVYKQRKDLTLYNVPNGSLCIYEIRPRFYQCDCGISCQSNASCTILDGMYVYVCMYLAMHILNKVQHADTQTATYLYN